MDLNTLHLISASTFTRINFPILWRLAKKITLATQLRTDTSASASYMQVTNYGLGGLCEPHFDPVGIMEVQNLSPGSMHLPYTGDIIGTFMAWLSNTKVTYYFVFVFLSHCQILDTLS